MSWIYGRRSAIKRHARHRRAGRGGVSRARTGEKTILSKDAFSFLSRFSLLPRVTYDYKRTEGVIASTNVSAAGH